MSAAPHPVLHRLFNNVVVDPGTVGPDAKAIGPRPAQHLSFPHGAQYDCASKINAHTTSRTSPQFV